MQKRGAKLRFRVRVCKVNRFGVNVRVRVRLELKIMV